MKRHGNTALLIRQTSAWHTFADIGALASAEIHF